MRLSQQDLDVRLQLSNCCIANKTNKLLKKIQSGSQDTQCALQELQVMNAMVEILQGYRVDTPVVQLVSGYSVEKDFFNPLNTNLTLYIDGVQISPTMVVSGFAVNIVQEMVDFINGYQSDYIATWISLSTFTLTTVIASCSEPSLTYITDDPSGTVLNITGIAGTCSTTGGVQPNCLTEEEAIQMFNYIAKRCDTSFQRPGFNYTT